MATDRPAQRACALGDPQSCSLPLGAAWRNYEHLPEQFAHSSRPLNPSREKPLRGSLCPYRLRPQLASSLEILSEVSP